MPDELGTLLKNRSENVQVPPQDLRSVLREGRRRRIVRHAASVGALVTLLVAGWALWVQVASLQQDKDVLPVDQPARRGIDRKLIIVPAPEGAGSAGPAESIDDARAVTFAFHTLVLNLDDYEYDYKDFEVVEGGWRVWFLDGPTEEDLEELIGSRENFIPEARSYLEDDQRHLERLLERLDQARANGDADEVTKLQRQIVETRRDIENWRQNIDDELEELARLETQLRQTREDGGPNRIELWVKQINGRMTVDRVAGPFTEDEAQRISAYSEPVQDVDVHGVDWYNVRLTSSRRTDSELPFEAHGFWTGPVPSPYKEECLIVLRDRSGEIVYRQPDIHDGVADDAPPEEDRRDGGAMASGLPGAERPLDELVPDFECHEVK